MTDRRACVTRADFGALPTGEKVEIVELINSNGLTARVLTYGATLQAMMVPDSGGEMADVVLGFADLDGYLAHDAYMGAIVGRYANRVAGGRFALDGQTYRLAVNNGSNAIHGGLRGFDKTVWRVVATDDTDGASLTLAHDSPDGDEGYPGRLSVTVTYALTEANALSIDYVATTDRPTVVNLTHHSYFNLAGEGSERSALDQELTVWADAFTPIDSAMAPTGEIRSVEGTPLDFRKPRRIADRIRDGREEQLVIARGHDHNYVLARGPRSAPALAARLWDPGSGRLLEVLTTEPGLQVYSGNYLDGTKIGKSGRAYRQSDGIALEAQHFPDSPNRPDFPSTRLDPGQTYRQTTLYRFGLATRAYDRDPTENTPIGGDRKVGLG